MGNYRINSKFEGEFNPSEKALRKKPRDDWKSPSEVDANEVIDRVLKKSGFTYEEVDYE